MYPISELKGQGTIYGCNAIYRHYPDLCDHIVASDPIMYQELVDAKKSNKFSLHTDVIGPERLPTWNYVLPEDREDDHPRDQNFYRFWIGGDYKTGKIKRRDFSENKGSGCSAVLHAAESGHRNILLIGFDIIGARQWELDTTTISREQNNVYKNTKNYPNRRSMKAYYWLSSNESINHTSCRWQSDAGQPSN